MSILLRSLALIGSLSYTLDRVGGRLVGALPIRVPVGVIVAVLLVVLAWGSAQETSRQIAARPRPMAATVAGLVQDPGSAWVSVAGLLSGPHVDNQVYARDRGTHYVRISDDPHDHVDEGGGEPVLEPGRRQTIFQVNFGASVTRWFYVLRDPRGDAQAIVVRSARDGAAIRTRSVEVEGAGSLDGLPRLVEVADAADARATARVGELGDGDRETIRAGFGDASEQACDGGHACRDGRTWRYLLTDAADPGATAWLDSPHPPDALPVTLTGVTTSDPLRMEIVLATPEMRDALEGFDAPTDLVLADQIGPVTPETSYLLAVVLAVVAGLLVLSAAVPYPIFRPDRHSGEPRRLPRPVVDELLPVEVDGRLPGASGAERVRGASGRIGWLAGRQLARRAWHLHSGVPAAGDDRPQLVLVAIEGNFVLPIEPLRDRLSVERGVLATHAGLRAALRLVAPDVRLTLGLESPEQRDTIGHEIETEVAPPPGRPSTPSALAPAATHPTWARAATAAALGLAALVASIAAAVELIGGTAVPVGTAAGLVSTAFLGLLALGIARDIPIARDLLPSIALLGLVVAAVMVPASLSCGSWLTPNLTECQPIGPIDLAPPLVAAAAFAAILWMLPRLPARGHPA